MPDMNDGTNGCDDPTCSCRNTFPYVAGFSIGPIGIIADIVVTGPLTEGGDVVIAGLSIPWDAVRPDIKESLGVIIDELNYLVKSQSPMITAAADQMTAEVRSRKMHPTGEYKGMPPFMQRLIRRGE
jgi:hypothetical protein